MTYLFYFGHPSQYLFLRKTLKYLVRNRKNRVVIVIKTKDVLEDLVKYDGFAYTNILPKERGFSRIEIVYSYLKRMALLLPIIWRYKPDLLVGTDATVAQLGWLLSIHRITIVEDDYAVIKNLASITYPYTETILCPNVCDVGGWAQKKIGYRGYMKLAYLHPLVFTPDRQICDKYGLPDCYILIRLARLEAHHDFGIEGIRIGLVKQLISIAENRGITVKISAEAPLEAHLNQYALKINPSDMHHVLAYSSYLISDSQSMTVEAAMLGVPSIRYSNLVGKISVLEELEHIYQLTIGIIPGPDDELLEEFTRLITVPDLRETFRYRRQQMLKDKINVSAFLSWFFQNYPDSFRRMKTDPAVQNQFS